jgi:hypothetical protein
LERAVTIAAANDQRLDDTMGADALGELGEGIRRENRTRLLGVGDDEVDVDLGDTRRGG